MGAGGPGPQAPPGSATAIYVFFLTYDFWNIKMKIQQS